MSIVRSVLALSAASLRQQQFICQSRGIKRWVAPTLREIRKRRTITRSHEKPVDRTTFTDWNPNAELFAFGKRLSEDFNLAVLQQAFIHPSYIAREQEKQREIGITSPTMEVQDNQALIEVGARALATTVSEFVDNQLTSAPGPLQVKAKAHLTSTPVIANLAKNLGVTELILSAESPVQDETLAKTFTAIIGALEESSGEERTKKFIHDFVCTTLSQMDWADLWSPENLVAELDALCAAKGLSPPEPRLIGQCGTNTLLASYNVAIYCDRKMIGSGFGETVDTATSQASLDALRGLYKIRNHQQFIRF